MPGTKNSRTARTSNRGRGGKSAPAATVPAYGWGAIALVLALTGAWTAAALWFFHRSGYLLYYGDAEAHLNIARRLFDSRTPGWEQLGTVWLPLPHLLMAPFARVDEWWRTGLAGALPTAGAFAVGGVFWFAALRRTLGTAAAAAGLAIYATNPNLLYLGVTPMTEGLFLAAFAALFYFTILFRDTRSWFAAAAAGCAVTAAALIRYEGWFLIPFAAASVWIAGRDWRKAALFAFFASLGPLSWLAHNRFYYSDALAFYWGPYSAKAIQGNLDYPGKNDWAKSWLYLRTAARLCAGAPLFWMGAAGLAAALVRRAFWAVGLCLAPAAFYLWSLHSSGTPIFVPELWPNSHYNARYGLSWLPLLALGAAALASLAPQRIRAAAAVAIALAAASPWILFPRADAWIVWKEAQVNHHARRQWTREAAAFLKERYRPGDGIFTSFGDLTGIYRTAGIPLRETLTGDNGPAWLAATQRGDLFLREQWAVAMGGDAAQTALYRARRRGICYGQAHTIAVKGAPVIEIWRRTSCK